MSGWRHGYMVLPAWMNKEVLKVHDATMICAPRTSQVAGNAALGDGNAHIEEFRLILATRRKLICERLDALPYVFQYTRPEGAYYVFPRIVAQHINSYAFSLHLLGKANVSVTPGSAFGPSGENHVRMHAVLMKM